MLIKQLIKDCQDCSLFVSQNPVPGEGSTNPKIMLIFEAPGEVEDKQQRPLVGPAGQELKAILNELDIGPDISYLTNVVKHRPPYNRTPTTDEISACAKKFLVKEIETLKPHIIVCGGKTAIKAICLLQNFEMPIHVRGNALVYKDIPCITTWHPSYVIRQKEIEYMYKKTRQELKDDIEKAYRMVHG